MDEKRSAFSVKAPGAPGSGAAVRLPGRGFPGLDDRLVVPEVTRDEMIGGRRVVASPAKEPHANQHVELGYVVRAHLASGYTASADMLTRHDEDSDFASDVAVYKKGVDPATGGRYLEEIAFEIVAAQSQRNVTEKAVRMHRRGVRRIFAVTIEDRGVSEWSPESRSWRPLPEGSVIEDPCFALPLPLKALLDTALADDAVAKALKARGNPEIRELEQAGREQGRQEGEFRVVLRLLRAKFGPLAPETEDRVRAAEEDRLLEWGERVLTAERLEDVFRD